MCLLMRFYDSCVVCIILSESDIDNALSRFPTPEGPRPRSSSSTLRKMNHSRAFGAGKTRKSAIDSEARIRLAEIVV